VGERGGVWSLKVHPIVKKKIEGKEVQRDLYQGGGVRRGGKPPGTKRLPTEKR